VRPRRASEFIGADVRYELEVSELVRKTVERFGRLMLP